KIGSKVISKRDTIEPYYRKITANKVLFAKEIVTSFPDEAFNNFKDIFAKIEQIFNKIIKNA
ncbi:MAG: hypothetical protein ACYDH2_16485, partial [Anaerolineaceae bacterium]